MRGDVAVRGRFGSIPGFPMWVDICLAADVTNAGATAVRKPIKQLLEGGDGRRRGRWGGFGLPALMLGSPPRPPLLGRRKLASARRRPSCPAAFVFDEIADEVAALLLVC